MIIRSLRSIIELMSIEVEKLPGGIGKDASFLRRVRDGRETEYNAGQGAGGDEVRVLDIREVFKDVPAVYEKGKVILAPKKYIRSSQVYVWNRPENLHKAFSETRPGGVIEVGSDELPWMSGRARVRLVEVELASGKTFRLGSVIKNANGIEQAARELGKERSKKINDRFYRGLAEYIETGRGANKVHDQRSRTPVLYFGIESGERVYFINMPIDRVRGNGAGHELIGNRQPTILLVAACHKSHQTHVLNCLTYVKNIKNKHP